MKSASKGKTPAEWQFDRQALASILDKMGRDDRSTKRSLATLSFDELYQTLNQDEITVIKQLLALEPKALGFLGPFVSLESPPQDLVELKNQVYKRDGKTVTIANQHLPKTVWQAFAKMQQAIKEDIGSRLMVESGYRSPAHQAIVFLTYLEKFDFNIKKVAVGVALPGYSQHGDPVNTAMDVINQDGVPTDEEPHLFAETKEYEWLLKNAERFNFHLSYPKDNPHGVKFEPWHWQYIVK